MSEEKKVETVNELEKKPQARTYSEEQFNGLLADKQAEVKKRQDIEKQLAEVKEKLPKENLQQSDNDRALTVGEFKKLMAHQRKADADADFDLRQAQSRETATKEYTAEKYGDGLDFETVLAEGEKNLTEGDLLAIKQSKNPAAEKYRRCVALTPELSQRSEAFRNSNMLEQIKLTGRVPATGSATEVTASGSDVSKMSDEELDKLAENIG